MSSDSVNIRFKELIEQDNIICSEQDMEEYLAYGLLFDCGKNKYITRDNKPISVTVVKPNKLDINLQDIINKGQQLAEENNVKKIYFMNERCYNNYKDKGLIITKKGKDYYRLFNNDEWLVDIISK